MANSSGSRQPNLDDATSWGENQSSLGFWKGSKVLS